MAAIGRVESGRRDGQGTLNPWPWTLNAEGQGSFYDGKAEAVAAVRALQARGLRSIDVGCMQVNLLHHPDAFASLEQAFDPTTNANYAARFLRTLYGQAGAWPRAAALYHSATPELAADYERRVMAAWGDEQRIADAEPRVTSVAAWGSGLRIVAANPPRLGMAGRIIPMAGGSGGGMPTGRGLDAYRAAPVAIAWRPAGG